MPALQVLNNPAVAKGAPAAYVYQGDSTGPALRLRGTGTPLLDIQDLSGNSKFSVNADGTYSATQTQNWGPFPSNSELGVLAQNFPNILAGAGAAAFSAGGVGYLAKIILTGAPISVTNVIYAIQTAGSTLTSGQCWIGLYDNTGTQIGVTADQTTNFGGTGVKTAALASGPFTGTWPFVYVAAVYNGTTGPAFARYTQGSSSPGIFALSATAANLRWATNGSAITTTMPGSFTYSSNSGTTSTPVSYWTALS